MRTPIRLLVLEDSSTDAELLVHELTAGGYDCVWRRADNGTSFASLLDGDVDLVIADYSLPSFTALDALDLVEERRLDVPVIVVTGAVGEESAVECLRRGAVDYLLKDRLARLADAVARALQDRRAREAARAIQRALVESEARFRRLAENAPDIIFRYRLVEPRGFDYISAAVSAVAGVTPRECYEDPDVALKLAHPDDRALIADLLADPGRRTGPTELRWIRPDGVLVWTEHRVAVLEDDEGRPVGCEGIIRDITDRKLAEEELRRAAQVLDRVASLVLVADRDGNITYANASVERVLGFSRAEVLGRGWWELSRAVPEDGDAERQRLAEIVGHDRPLEPRPYVTKLVDRSGRMRWFEWYDERGPGDTIVGVGQDVTERRLAEEERRQLIESLAASEAKFRALVEQVPVVTYAAAVSPVGQTLYVSPQIERLLGVPSERFVSEPSGWATRLHPDDRARVIGEVRALHDRGRRHALEYRIGREDGEYIWVRDEGEVVHDAAGQPLCVQGVMFDITDRKRAEAALQDSNHALQTLIDASPLAIVEVDRSRRVRVWNRAAERLFGWAAGELLCSANPIVPSSRESEYHSFCDRALDGERLIVETQRQRRDGSLVDVLLSVAPIAGADGSIRSVVALFADISDRKQAEALLREREEHFRSLIENAHDMIAVVDAAGVLTYVSPAVLRLLGHSPEGVVGTSAFQSIHPDDAELAWNRFAAARAGQLQERMLTIRVRHADGSWRSFEAVANPQHPGDPTSPLIVNARDVTERTALEQQLRQAQKMEAIGLLAGGIAHDFNNVLTAILGYGQLLRLELPEGSAAAADVDEIMKAGERAGALTRQLLAFGRKQVLHPQPLSLTALVAELQKMLGRLIGEDVQLRTALDAALTPVLADSHQMQQVLLNLVVNARDAMPRGGALTITTGNVALDRPWDDRQARLAPGRWVMLSVSDTGIGMPPEIAARVFEPFFTTKEPGRGTGLGLSTVYGIVAQSGGQIALETEIGVGTTFRIYLPAADVCTGADARAPAGSARGGTETILLVEDEPGVRRLIRTMLERQGYAVLEAADAEEATSLAGGDGTIDLLLSDVVMPGTSGVDLAQHLLGVRPDLKVLHMSGFAMAPHGGELSPNVGFLQKPFTPDALTRTVRECLDRPIGGTPCL
jgi:PAS domain S-box-containing protein